MNDSPKWMLWCNVCLILRESDLPHTDMTSFFCATLGDTSLRSGSCSHLPSLGISGLSLRTHPEQAGEMCESLVMVLFASVSIPMFWD